MPASATVPIDQRFAQLIQQFGLTKNSFAISLGKTASVVQHLIDGRNKPGYDLLCKVFEIYPNVSRDWLLLGRGPMLVSGEAAPKAIAPIVAPVPERPFEPIDLTDVELPMPRRQSPGVAGTQLQPAEIAATLALAAAANPASLASPAANPAAHTSAPVTTPVHAAAEMPASGRPPEAPIAPAVEAPGPVVSSPGYPAQPPAPVAPVAPVAAAAAPLVASPTPEVYVAAALHAQHLQHQLALAEMRNQHLLDQQVMLREMLAMARQAMV